MLKIASKQQNKIGLNHFIRGKRKNVHRLRKYISNGKYLIQKCIQMAAESWGTKIISLNWKLFF